MPPGFAKLTKESGFTDDFQTLAASLNKFIQGTDYDLRTIYITLVTAAEVYKEMLRLHYSDKVKFDQFIDAAEKIIQGNVTADLRGEN